MQHFSCIRKLTLAKNATDRSDMTEFLKFQEGIGVNKSSCNLQRNFIVVDKFLLEPEVPMKPKSGADAFHDLVNQFDSISLGQGRSDRTLQSQSTNDAPGAGTGISKEILQQLVTDEINSTSAQLGTIFENVYNHDINGPVNLGTLVEDNDIEDDDNDGDESSWDKLNDVLETFGTLGTTLMPSGLESSDLVSSIASNKFQIIKLKREIHTIENQTEENQRKEEDLFNQRQEITEAFESKVKIVRAYNAEMEGCTLDELENYRRSYQDEIDAEEPIYSKLQRDEAIYNGQKIQESMATVQELHEQLENLKKQISFSTEIPPDLGKAKNALAARKQELKLLIEEIRDKTDRLANY